MEEKKSMQVIKLNQENAADVARLMTEIRPIWWPTFEDAYGQLTNIEESIGTVGWYLQDDQGKPVGWTLFRELKGYLALELECSGYNGEGSCIKRKSIKGEWRTK